MFKGKSSFLFFYVLMGYIFIAFIWWMYLLLQISNESFSEKRTLLQLNYSLKNHSNSTFEQSDDLKNIELERKEKGYMIFGEGSFFLVVLLLMTWMMHRSLLREAALSQQQKNFLLSITHELRSPIAASKVAMQTLQKYRDLPDEKRIRLIGNSLQDLERLQGLVENLLLAAKIEDHNFSIGHVMCDLSEIVASVVQKFKESSDIKREFELSIQPEITVTGDQIGLTSVVTNLIENAVRYSAEGSKISTRLNRENGFAVLQIIDSGLGISDTDKKKIFKKFYRVGNEETRKTKGTGLGLYIVEKILSMHQGKVIVKDNKPIGTIFEVTIPATI